MTTEPQIGHSGPEGGRQPASDPAPAAPPAYAPAGPPANYAPAGPPAAYGPAGPQPSGSYPGPGLAPGSYPPPMSAGPGAAGQAPGVGPVVAFTFFFGIFGAISAARRSKRAQAAGISGRKYWIAFAITLVAAWVVGVIAVVAVAVASSAGKATVSSASLERSIVANSDFTTPDGTAVTAEAATCTPGMVDNDGAGSYTCVIDFAGNDSMSYQVTLDTSGKWIARPQ